MNLHRKKRRKSTLGAVKHSKRLCGKKIGMKPRGAFVQRWSVLSWDTLNVVPRIQGYCVTDWISGAMKSFCEPVWAGPLAPWCVRELTDKGRFLGGGVDTDSFCGRVRDGEGWDLETAFDMDLDHFCKLCRLEILRRHELDEPTE